MSRALRLAHRGDWRHAPENSLGAFLAALAVPNCDGLEFDVRAAADGTPVVLHDETLERVQGRPGRADELSVVELSGAGVPTLREVLGAVGPDAFLDVELKGDPGPGAIEILERGRGSRLSNAVVSSFEVETLERVALARSRWPRWLNVEDVLPATLDAALELRCAGVSAWWRALDERSIARARERGLEVAAWTVRRRPTVARLERLGVGAICVEAKALDG
jgi:glycerophosphoryl diester phosphodiesterase